MRIPTEQTIALFSCLLLWIAAGSCSGRPGKAKETSETYSARISFADSVHDFGTFPANAPLQEHTFTFENNGSVPAVLLSAAPSCQCTSAKYTRSIVRPGEKGSVTVIFDGTKAPPGYFSKSVRIRINSLCVYTLRVEGKMQSEKASSK